MCFHIHPSPVHHVSSPSPAGEYSSAVPHFATSTAMFKGFSARVSHHPVAPAAPCHVPIGLNCDIQYQSEQPNEMTTHHQSGTSIQNQCTRERRRSCWMMLFGVQIAKHPNSIFQMNISKFEIEGSAHNVFHNN